MPLTWPMPVMPDTCELRDAIEASYAESAEPVSVTAGVAAAKLEGVVANVACEDGGRV